MSAASENRELPRLAVMARALGLLVAQGASFGLLAWEIHAWPTIVPYAVNNTLVPNCRAHLVAAMGSGVGLAVILGTLLILLGKGRGVDLLHRVAYRSAPLCLIALVPLLFDWELWVERDLTFLALTAVFGLALQGLMRIVLATPPVFAVKWPRLRPWMNRPLAVLRWPHLPLVIACLAGTFCTAYFGYYTVVNHYNVRTSGYDLGIETNVVWHAAHGGPLLRSTPLGGQMNLLGLHHTFFAYVMAPVFRLVPRAETLLVLQSIFMGAAVVPLFLIARRRVGPAVACLVSCLLVLYPPFHGAVLYDFHYQPLSTFFLLMSLHLLEVRRNWWGALVILLTFSLREDMAALLAIVGLYLVLTGKRPQIGRASCRERVFGFV
jgi:hypothetical protein